MYENLKSIGVIYPEKIERYTLRQEAAADILKIYYQKDKGDLFAKSVKFKFPRQHKTVLVNGGTGEYREVSEISPELRYIVQELDQLAQKEQQEQVTKEKILSELRHLEKVVTSKIAEIEQDLKKL
ncbi:DUF3461 family protein [Celerinatantimonas sp. MCCC 1A17872]|uniref:DUF3461 family protein n=1 Tax=Celerinatantimonas sp. MCCC 1A17872 TaxID=3177514 RepID=UPI0038C5B38D